MAELIGKGILMPPYPLPEPAEPTPAEPPETWLRRLDRRFTLALAVTGVDRDSVLAERVLCFLLHRDLGTQDEDGFRVAATPAESSTLLAAQYQLLASNGLGPGDPRPPAFAEMLELVTIVEMARRKPEPPSASTPPTTAAAASASGASS